MDLLGAITSVGSGLLNFIGGQSAQDKAIEAQRATNAENWDHSLFMAKNSIQMRKADAEAAGIHPLYAMGAPTMSFAPAQVGAAGVASNRMAPIAGAMRDLGQDLGRSAAANVAPESKVAAVVQGQQVVSNKLDLETKELQNQLLKARIANLTQPGTPPGAFPVPENPKPEQRPPLMAGGYRWKTNPNTSPMKAWEDQYGDEGPVASTLPLAILANDAVYNWRTHPNVADNWNKLSSGTAAIGRWFNAAKGRMLTGGSSGYYEGR